jgi:hypothetical protein
MTNPYFLNNGEYQGDVKGDFEVVPFFIADELACPTAKIIQYEPIYLCRLTTLRVMVDHSMPVNSGGRTPSYNKLLEGAHVRSLHQTINPVHKNYRTGQALKACANDISTRGWSNAKIKNFVAKAELLGFSVGIAKSFIHIDGRDLAGLPQHRFYYWSAKAWYENI